MAKSRLRPLHDDDVSMIRHDKGGKLIKGRQRRGGWTQARRNIFLSTLADTCNVTVSCQAAGMSTGAIYPLRQRDAGFRAAWAAALKEGYVRLELAMLERAIHGTDRAVYHLGTRIDTVKQYSDATAFKLLAHHRAAGIALPAGVLDPATVAEARASIERRIRAIKLQNSRTARTADRDRG